MAPNTMGGPPERNIPIPREEETGSEFERLADNDREVNELRLNKHDKELTQLPDEGLTGRGGI